MKAILTRQNPDGTYNEVGMNNRIVTGDYKTLERLIHYGIPTNFRGTIRVEIYNGDSILGKPNRTIYTKRWEMNIEERLNKLYAAHIAGNHFEDSHLFNEADAIILDEDATKEQKFRALAFIDKLTGTSSPINDQALAEYLENIA